jgi:hypothetical protein
MNYFIHEGQSQAGPFSYDELKIKQIQSTTPVWREGLNKWVEASELPELSGLFTSVPPPFPPQPSSTAYSPSTEPISGAGNAGYRVGRTLGIGGMILLTALLVLYFYNQSVNRYTGTYVPSIPIADPEHNHPDWFLSTQGTYKTNFWGNKEEITGSIINKATHTNYKDVRIKVEFLSQTKTVISSQEYVIDQYVSYGSTPSFSLSLPKPPATASVGLGVVSATYY